MITENKYNKTLNNAIDKKQYYLIDSIFADYSKLDLNQAIALLAYSIKSDLFEKNVLALSNNFPNYWECLATYFRYFSNEEQTKILGQISRIEVWNTLIESAAYRIYLEYVKNFDEVKRVDTLSLYFSKFIKNGISIPAIDLGITDKTINSLWVAEHLESITLSSEPAIFTLKYNFSRITFVSLLNKIKVIDHQNRFTNISLIEENDSLNFLYKLIEGSCLQYNVDSTFPQIFYNFSVIQKIYINLWLKDSQIISYKTLTKIVKAVNPIKHYYGKEINHFIKSNSAIFVNVNANYSEFREKSFSDMFIEIRSEDTSRNPFFVVDEVDNVEKVNYLLSRLSTLANRKTDYSNSFSINAQKREITQKLSSVAAWTKNGQYTSLLISRLISNQQLMSEYENVVVDLLKFAMEKNLADKSLPRVYLNSKLKYGILSNFSYNLEKFFECLIESNHVDTNDMLFFYDVLFKKTRIKSLDSTNSGINSKTNYIDLLDFINTDLGRYYSVIKKIPVNVIQKQYIGDLSKGIRSLEAKYQSYLYGVFYKIYKDSEIYTNPNDLMFIGFSHTYHLFPQSDSTGKFIEQARNLFDSNIKDEMLTRNIAVVLSENIDPLVDNYMCNYENIEYKKKILHQILDLYFYYPNDNKTHATSWVRWYIRNFNFTVDVVASKTALLISEVDIRKVDNLSIIFRSEQAIMNNYKVSEFAFMHIRNCEKLTHDQHKVLMIFLKLLLQNNVLVISTYLLHGIYQISDDLLSKSYFDLLNDYAAFLREFMPVNDFTSYSNKYLSK